MFTNKFANEIGQRENITESILLMGRAIILIYCRGEFRAPGINNLR